MRCERELLSYWVVAPGRGELRRELLPDPQRDGTCIVHAEFGTVSAGTERLVGSGLVPEGCEAQMACAHMCGSFALPVKYGYSVVGRAMNGPLVGERVFLMHPHQTRMHVEPERLQVLPPAVPSTRAVLFPNLETALNAVWDAELQGGERCAIVGAGMVGLLIAFAMREESACSVDLVEASAARREEAQALPWVAACVRPEDCAASSYDVVFHCTGKPGVVDFALGLVGFEGRMLELSWFGQQAVTLQLGDEFHYLRKRLIASQVAHVAPAKRQVLGRAGRSRRVLELLESEELDALVGPELPFLELPAYMDSLYRGEAAPLAPLLVYGGGESRAGLGTMEQRCTP